MQWGTKIRLDCILSFVCVLRHIPDREGLVSSNFSGVNLRRRDFNPSKCVSKAFSLAIFSLSKVRGCVR